MQRVSYFHNIHRNVDAAAPTPVTISLFMIDLFMIYLLIDIFMFIGAARPPAFSFVVMIAVNLWF